MSSELNVQPIDVGADTLKGSDTNWWRKEDNDEGGAASKTSKFSADGLFGHKNQTDVLNVLCKEQHMTTDVKKAVFMAIMSAEDYL